MCLDKPLLIWHTSCRSCKLRSSLRGGTSRESRFISRSHRRDADSRTGCRRHRSVQNCGSLHFGVDEESQDGHGLPCPVARVTASWKNASCGYAGIQPQVAYYARGDIGPQFATIYRLPTPKNAPFAIGYTFESKSSDAEDATVSGLQVP